MFPIPAPIPTPVDVSHSKTSFSQGLSETLVLSPRRTNLNHQVGTHWKGLNNLDGFEIYPKAARRQTLFTLCNDLVVHMGV